MHISIFNSPNKSIRNRSTSSISYHAIVYILITVLVGLSFYPALDNQFLYWDDQYYVIDNIYISQPTWEHFQQLWTKVISLNYHPITMLSLWLNSVWFGTTSTTPFIVTNVILHAITSCLICRFVLALFTDKYLLAVFTAVIFAIHPMHVESVVWVSERKDVLYAFFFFAALLSWMKFIKTEHYRWLAFSILLFLLSCLSKAMAVSLVPVILLVDIFQKRKWWSLNSILTKLPFILIALLTGLVAVDVQQGGNFYGYLSNTNTDVAIDENLSFSFGEKVNNLGYGLFFYLKNFLFPLEMSAFHPYDFSDIDQVSMLYLSVPIFLLLVLVYSYRYSRVVFLGLSFFLLTIALVLQWIPVGSAIVADRYSYIPYVGLAIIVGRLLQYIFDYKSKWIALVLCFSMVLPLSASSYHQSDIWQDQISLFTKVVDRYPEDAKSRILLATGYWMSNKHNKAIEEIEFAINTLGLHTSDAFEKLANCYEEIGEREKATAFYNHSIELDPLNYVARYHRGICIMDIDPAKALQDFNVAESSGFEYIIKNIYGPRGVCHGRLGQYDLALNDLTKAIDLGQNLKINYRDRAVTYDALGMPDKAQEDREMANSFE